MDEKTLLQTIQEFFPELRIMPQDLKNPSPEFSIGFYKRVLAELEVDLNSLLMIQGSQMNRLSNVELYQDIIPTLNLSKAINFIFSQVGLDKLNFGLSDLVAPTPKRNLMLMSNIMNFILHCDERAAEFDPKFKAFQDFKAKFRELLRKRNELKAKVNQQATERAHRQKHKEELLFQKKTAEKLVQELAFEKEEFKVLQKQAKAQLNAENKELEKATYQLKALEEELASLKTQIVASPEELSDQYEKLVAQRNEAKEKADNELIQIEPKRETLKKLTSAIEDQETRMAILNEIIELNKIVENSKAEKGSLSKEKSSAEEGAEDAHVQLNLLQNKYKAVQESLKESQEKWNIEYCNLRTHQESLETELNETQEKYDKAVEQKEFLQDGIDEADAQLNELTNKFHKLQATSKTLVMHWKNIQENAFKNARERIEELEEIVKKL